MTYKGGSGFTLEEGFIKKGDIGYKAILMFHMNRISNIACKLAEEGQSFNLVMAINALEQFLRPYLDKQYKEDKAEIEAHWRIFWDKEVSNKPENIAEPKRQEYNRGKSLDLIGTLCTLMGRRNLLMEKEVILNVGGPSGEAQESDS